MKNKTLLFAALVSVFGWCCISCESNDSNQAGGGSSTYEAKGFSISAGKQVNFSKGNLQYTQSTETWAFAANQYDMIGEANVDGDELADKIDLFGRSGNTATAKWGISTSIGYSAYSGDFADWGQNIGDGRTWRTLTHEEWQYVLSKRRDADKKIGVARINLDAEGTTYSNGLILLPDGWNSPLTVAFKFGFASEDSEQAYADYQTLTLEQWENLEKAGAVFLPATGNRDGSNISDVQYRGDYWTSTPYDGSYAPFTMHFQSLGTDDDYSCDDCIGLAVRLVQDL